MSFSERKEEWLMAEFITYIRINYISIIFAFGASFLVGFALALSTVRIDSEGRKKGFKSERFTGYDRKLDKKLLKEYRDGFGTSPYLQDNQEHHASKKFK